MQKQVKNFRNKKLMQNARSAVVVFHIVKRKSRVKNRFIWFQFSV